MSLNVTEIQQSRYTDIFSDPNPIQSFFEDDNMQSLIFFCVCVLFGILIYITMARALQFTNISEFIPAKEITVLMTCITFRTIKVGLSCKKSCVPHVHVLTRCCYSVPFLINE